MNNLSPVSVYENVTGNDQSFSKSSVYRTINDLLSINGDVEFVLHCPLCVGTFEYKFSLFEHLITLHRNFLVKVRDRTLRFKECPFCSAKFYGKHLTAKHGLLYHSKVIKELYIDCDSKCFFCGLELNRNDFGTMIKHIEEMHFIDFEEEFKLKFCTSITEMTFSEFINSTIENNKTSSFSFFNDSVDSGELKRFPSLNDQDFEEASKLNCFDFTDLKSQLLNIKDSKSSKRKSILKNSKNKATPKSVRRVLRFDIPDEENKENVVKQINLTEEPTFLCDNDNHFMRDILNTTPDDWCDMPQHCSTPNSKLSKSKGKILVKDDMKKLKQPALPYIYSVSDPQNVLEYEFQCGKCRKLFKENLDLVFHIKNNHKQLGLKVLKPSYRCAICNARFFRNHYLKKHHQIHEPY